MPSLMFVQFPHPGSEHRPTSDPMPWRRGEHGRKFLRSHGRYLDGERLREGPIAFWGEWEPPSHVERLAGEGRGHPTWLHDPFWTRERHRRGLANTDPVVFGDRFLYSNCRQGRNAKLRDLAPGSIVVFGSKLDGGFVLDTLLVVAGEGIDYERGATSAIACEEWVRAVVFDTLSAPGKGHPTDRFRLYRGLMHRDRPSGPFSFVPCRPDGPDRSFARPAIELDRRWITPGLAMGARATPASAEELMGLWGLIVGQVQAVGLHLAVSISAPPRCTDP